MCKDCSWLRETCPCLTTRAWWSLKNETEAPRCGHQPTGSCGFLAAFLTGQTCSSCCWTERHYWFSTQRTRRLHRCPKTLLTGCLCLNAAERTNTTWRGVNIMVMYGNVGSPSTNVVLGERLEVMLLRKILCKVSLRLWDIQPQLEKSH